MRDRFFQWFLFVVVASTSVMGQQTAGKKVGAVRLSAAEVSQLAHTVSVQVVVPNYEQGSGVWVNREGYVATCWHVVKTVIQAGQVIVRAGTEFRFDFNTGNIVQASYLVRATVVRHDEVADVAILKVEASPFERPPGTYVQTPTENITAHFAVPEFQDTLPSAGAQVTLAGYPLQGLYYLSQIGTVAGEGLEGSYLPPLAQKSLRLFVSVTSNPGNSGGPVLNESGKLVGLLRGNFLSPMKDESTGLLPITDPSVIRPGSCLPTRVVMPSRKFRS